MVDGAHSRDHYSRGLAVEVRERITDRVEEPPPFQAPVPRGRAQIQGVFDRSLRVLGEDLQAVEQMMIQLQRQLEMFLCRAFCLDKPCKVAPGEVSPGLESDCQGRHRGERTFRKLRPHLLRQRHVAGPEALRQEVDLMPWWP